MHVADDGIEAVVQEVLRARSVTFSKAHRWAWNLHAEWLGGDLTGWYSPHGMFGGVRVLHAFDVSESSDVDLIRASAALPAGTALCVNERRALCVRSDAAMATDDDVAKAVHAVLDGLYAGIAIDFSKHDGVSSINALEENESAGLDLPELDWELTARQPGAYSVVVGSRGETKTARIQRTGDGWLVYADVVCIDEVDDACWPAVSAFVLRVNDALRLARACFRRIDGAVHVVVEAGLPHDPNARLGDQALSAVSAGYGICAREVRALCDAGLARTYLEIAGSAMGVDAVDGAEAHFEKEVSHVG